MRVITCNLCVSGKEPVYSIARTCMLSLAIILVSVFWWRKKIIVFGQNIHTTCYRLQSVFLGRKQFMSLARTYILHTITCNLSASVKEAIYSVWPWWAYCYMLSLCFWKGNSYVIWPEQTCYIISPTIFVLQGRNQSIASGWDVHTVTCNLCIYRKETVYRVWKQCVYYYLQSYCFWEGNSIFIHIMHTIICNPYVSGKEAVYCVWPHYTYNHLPSLCYQEGNSQLCWARTGELSFAISVSGEKKLFIVSGYNCILSCRKKAVHSVWF